MLKERKIQHATGKIERIMFCAQKSYNFRMKANKKNIFKTDTLKYNRN